MIARTKWLLLIIVIVSIISSGCNDNGLTMSDEKKDRQKVVAEVNGEKILKGELLDSYEQDKLFYGVTEEDEKKPENKDVIKNFKNDILEELIYGRIAMQKAKQAGYRITDKVVHEADRKSVV